MICSSLSATPSHAFTLFIVSYHASKILHYTTTWSITAYLAYTILYCTSHIIIYSYTDPHSHQPRLSINNHPSIVLCIVAQTIQKRRLGQNHCASIPIMRIKRSCLQSTNSAIIKLLPADIHWRHSGNPAS